MRWERGPLLNRELVLEEATIAVRIAHCAVAATVLACAIGAAPAAPPAAIAAAPLTLDWNRTPAQIKATCSAEIARAGGRIAALTRTRSARTFDSVVLPLETIFADLNDNTAAELFLTNVSTDAAVRDASQACNTDEAAFTNEVTARPVLYAALKAAQASNTAAGDAQLKLTELWLTASARAGAGLPDAQRADFVKLSTQLNDIENQYRANLGNDATSITITSAQLAGLSPDFIATLTKSGANYVVPVNESTTSPFMQNASDEAARKAFFFAFSNRGGPKNVALLQTAIAIRDHLAHLLGYPTWAAFTLADKMAQTPQRVLSFLSTIDAAILPKARAEVATLAALKGGAYENWDRSFYENMLRKQRYSVDQNEITQYFPVQHTVDAVLGIYAKLLGVTFKRIASPNTYNAEVNGYEVHDAGNGVMLGNFYLDLFPRPGKYDHFASFTIVPRRVMPDGTVRAPIVSIVGNWARPAPGAPGLLSHSEVETFFHEFGHNMAAMLADEPYATLTTGFRFDFIEAPSQMLENWAWDPGILKQISANVTTGAPLPDALIAKMIAARYLDYAYFTTQQILYATVDMRYHMSPPPVDTTAIWKSTTAATSPTGFVDGTLPQAAFGHLMGGYDAGYYGYLWSKVYAQDMFSAFKVAGLEDPAVGRRYRYDILAPARTYEPDAEVSAFLGRPMNPAAFYAELGIAAQASMR